MGHKGKELEAKFAKDGSLPDPASTTNPEFKCILQLLKDSIQTDATKYTRMAGVPWRERGDDDWRPPSQRDGGEGRAPLPRHQRERLRDEVEVRQRLRLPPLAAGQHHARHGRDDRREERPGL